MSENLVILATVTKEMVQLLGSAGRHLQIQSFQASHETQVWPQRL